MNNNHENPKYKYQIRKMNNSLITVRMLNQNQYINEKFSNLDESFKIFLIKLISNKDI